MAINIPITQKGYIYIYVSNETPGAKVWFDDLTVTHIENEVVQADDYYPFGLTMAATSYQGEDRLENKFKYQGQELQEETGLHQFYLRSFDSELGRWHSIDPYDQYDSPYLAMGNDPVSNIDPDGGTALGFAIGFGVGFGIGYAASDGDLGIALASGLGGGLIGSGVSISSFTEGNSFTRISQLSVRYNFPKITLPSIGGTLNALSNVPQGSFVLGELINTGNKFNGDPLTVNEYLDFQEFQNGGPTPGFINELVPPPASGAIENPVLSPEELVGGAIGAVAKTGIKVSTRVLGKGAVDIARTPVGRSGNVLRVITKNTPTRIDGVKFTGHALDQMQARGILSPRAVLDVIKNPTRTFPGNTPGKTVFIRDNLKVITNKLGDIITVIPQ